MWCRPARRRLDDMSIYEIMPSTTTFLAEEGERWGRHGFHPWFLVARLVFLVLVIAAVWLFLRYAVVASRGVWRSLVARFVRDEEVVGSNPATPTSEAFSPPRRRCRRSSWALTGPW
jgi:hypothetical protein